MDPIGIEENARANLDENDCHNEKLAEIICSVRSLSKYEGRSLRTLGPQICAAAISASYHIAVGISLAYSAILIPHLNLNATSNSSTSYDIVATKTETSWIGSRVNQNRLLEFQVSPEAGSQLGQEFRVREASLWLKADVVKRASGKCRTTDIFVFKIISNRLPESVTLSSKQFDRLTTEPIAATLDESNSGWQKIDVTQTVRAWLSEPSNDKLRLFVDCSCCAHWRIHLFNEDGDKWSSANRPFLVIHTDPNTAKRVRRRAIDCSVDSGNQCCKQRFYVSFKALGWEDWVIAPQGYYANYCRGDCGHHRTPDTFVTYHTHVIEEVRKTQHLSGMTPCCAPLKFSSMSLIYYGPESTIIKRDLPKMVVDECGCP